MWSKLKTVASKDSILCKSPKITKLSESKLNQSALVLCMGLDFNILNPKNMNQNWNFDNSNIALPYSSLLTPDQGVNCDFPHFASFATLNSQHHVRCRNNSMHFYKFFYGNVLNWLHVELFFKKIYSGIRTQKLSQKLFVLVYIPHKWGMVAAWEMYYLLRWCCFQNLTVDFYFI